MKSQTKQLMLTDAIKNALAMKSEPKRKTSSFNLDAEEVSGCAGCLLCF
jgi:hypothetical protein